VFITTIKFVIPTWRLYYEHTRNPKTDSPKVRLWAIPALGYSIWSDLRKTAHGNKGTLAGAAVLKEKKYKRIEADMGAIPIGPKGGVGVIFGWRIPSWLVWLLKSRTYMLDNAAGLATGAGVMKA
jgi:hypothetical protein